MNRSILIVICDFLLVSLLMFSTPDINKVANPNVDQPTQLEIVTNRSDSRKDLAAVMRLALEEERKGRDQLANQLTQSHLTLQEQQATIGDREKQIQAVQQQYAAAQTNLQNLNQQLQATKASALMSAEKAAELQQRVSELVQTNQAILAEKQKLATELLVTATERRAATQMLAKLQEEVQVERQEKARLTEHADKLADNVGTLAAKSSELAEGVKALTSNSSQLSQEIRENRQLAPNTVFSEFVTNRVQAGFFGSHSGLFGIAVNKRRDTDTVLITDGTNTFAVCHVADTPLAFSTPGAEWFSLTGSLSRGQTLVPISTVSFSRLDPRIVLIPLTAAQALKLGSRIYRISADPFKFQDAIIVGASEGYYGECKFRIDLSTPSYLKMDRNFLKGLFGKFNPSRGDMVFSQSGELLGIMANSTYCLMLQNCQTAATLNLGEDIRDQHSGSMLSSFNVLLVNMPPKLQ